MSFNWGMLAPLMYVPYVPTLGPVHPDTLRPKLLADVLRVAGTRSFLRYDPDARWGRAKRESVMPEHIRQKKHYTLIPTLDESGNGTVTVYHYGDRLFDTYKAADLAGKLAADHGLTHARASGGSRKTATTR